MLYEVITIDVASINNMWIIRPGSHIKEDEKGKMMQRQILDIATNILKNRCSTLIIDIYDGSIVVFMDKQSMVENSTELACELENALAQNEIDATLVICYNLETTTDVRQAYLAVSNGLEYARKIFCHKKQLTLHEILFAHSYNFV